MRALVPDALSYAVASVVYIQIPIFLISPCHFLSDFLVGGARTIAPSMRIKRDAPCFSEPCLNFTEYSKGGSNMSVNTEEPE